MRPHPHIYELNAWIFLQRLSERHGRRVTLGNVPREEWRELRALGFDLVWVMGAWRRSPGARRRGLGDIALWRAYDQALGAWTDADVVGSPYAVYDYTLEPSLGGEHELAELRGQLHEAGLGLVLDFVPNHLALDHPWTRDHPERLLRVTKEQARSRPERYFSLDGASTFAHGRDPYFPSWTDTVQVDCFAPELRAAFADELERIAGLADGVRCDMAMLGLNRIFAQVWGDLLRGRRAPERELWSELIEGVKARWPGFLFIAEAYWSLEWDLQQLGFDYTYDKTLYDRLVRADIAGVHGHLGAEPGFQARSLRFVENHDEPRAVLEFGRERSLSAAAVAGSVPGLRLYHDGQLEGRRVRLPVQLGREPAEARDDEVSDFYRRLLEVTHDTLFHTGRFELAELAEQPANGPRPLAWHWRSEERSALVVVNLSVEPTEARIRSGAAAPRPVLKELLLRAAREQKDADPQTIVIELDAHGVAILEARPAF